MTLTFVTVAWPRGRKGVRFSMIWLLTLAALLAGGVPVHAVQHHPSIAPTKGAVANGPGMSVDETLPGGPSVAASALRARKPLDTLPGGPSH
jgi:hypothetical protein